MHTHTFIYQYRHIHTQISILYMYVSMYVCTVDRTVPSQRQLNLIRNISKQPQINLGLRPPLLRRRRHDRTNTPTKAKGRPPRPWPSIPVPRFYFPPSDPEPSDSYLADAN